MTTDPTTAPRAASLVEVDGSRTFALQRKLILVGSSPMCNVQITDRGVAEQHAYLLERDGHWFVKPVSPRATCVVNGVSTQTESVLAHGDILQLGKRLAFRFDEGRTGPAHSGAQALRDHSGFLQLFTEVLKARDLRQALDRMVARLASILRCDGVALMEWNPDNPIVLLAAHPHDSRPANFSRNCLLQTWEKDVALALRPFDLVERPSESISVNQVGSVLCAPLAGIDSAGLRVFLYLDRFTGTDPFSIDEVDYFESIRALLGEILTNARLKQTQAERISRIQSNVQDASGMIHQSPTMTRLLAHARKVAAIDAPIFIQGETGTGKELLARQIHAWSPRAEASFHAINCGAITPSLLESELFGHEKGAFTGAHAQKTGWIEKAHGGTLFLDEIGDLELGLQVKLLRVIQEGEYSRVGGTETLRADFRLVTATHRDLESMVKAKTFREDLYYRVNVIRIELPPLRDRPDDIPLLSTHFLRKHSERLGLAAPQIGHKAERWLLSQSWPGNVRQLENALQKAVILCEGPTLLPEHLEPSGATSTAATETVDDLRALPSLDEVREEAERDICTKALARTRGNVVKAAELLRTDRRTLQRVMDRIGLQASMYRR